MFRLLQLRVLRLCFLQDGNVSIGLFPEAEGVLVGILRLGRIACHREGAPELKMGQCSRDKVLYDTPMIQQLLELGGCRSSVMCQQVGLATQIRREMELMNAPPVPSS